MPTAAFKFHLDLHLAKEETHMYRIIRERLPLPDQGKMVDRMCFSIPQHRFADFIAWVFPLMGQDDRENMTRVWQMLWPAESVAWATPLIREAIGNDWPELCHRVPELCG